MNADTAAIAASARPADTTLHIRDATADDMPAIQAIYAHHVLHGRASFEERAPTVDDMRLRRAEVLCKSLPYLVAERIMDGRAIVAGYAYAGPYRARSAYRYAIEDSIYLDERFRGQGIGPALLAALIARCEAGPWRQMVAVVACTASGEGAGSLALHERMGFRTIGRLEAVGFKHGQWIDTVLMQRELGGGSRTLPEAFGEHMQGVGREEAPKGSWQGDADRAQRTGPHDGGPGSFRTGLAKPPRTTPSNPTTPAPLPWSPGSDR
jgi:phosphinothricin acetyltransferase